MRLMRRPSAGHWSLLISALIGWCAADAALGVAEGARVYPWEIAAWAGAVAGWALTAVIWYRVVKGR
jgi:hypothetical protein